MKALAKLTPSVGLTLTSVEKPEVGPNDVLIKIKKTAICGTDIHIWKWDEWAQKTIPVPMHVGHEYVGVIAEMGQEVRGFKIGDRVSGEGHITCGFCRNCRAGRRHLCRNTVGVGVNRAGAFAEYLAIPAVNAFKIPDDISDDLAAIFDPFGNATHTALSFNLVGEDVLITGAGPIGIMAVAIARHVGRAPLSSSRTSTITAWSSPQDGRDARGECEPREPRRREDRVAHGRRLRRRPRDVGRAVGVHLDARAHEPRRQDRAAGHSAVQHRDRLEPGHLQGPGSSRASTAARCSRPGTRWSPCCRAGWT